MEKENKKVDPWDVDPEDVKRFKESVRAKSKGVFCPSMNPSIKERCFVCESIRPLWKFPIGSKERDLASNKKATVSYFFNALLPHNPNKALVVEIGKKAGDTIISNMTDSNLGWKTVANPKAGKGFLIKISKRSDSGYNSYPVNKGDAADSDVSKDVLGNLTNLSNANIISMINNDEFNDENYMHINSIKMDETITLRILPAWNWKETGNRQPLYHVYRHWGGVTESEVNGESKIDLSIDSEETQSPESDILSRSTQTVNVEEKDIPAVVERLSTKATPQSKPCFSKWYESEEKDCIECELAKPCARAMAV